MSKKELTALDISLCASDIKDKILVRKRGFFIYYNDPNKNSKDIKIHTHNCGFCAWGSGRDTKLEAGRNGVWIGPFNTINQAENFIITILKSSQYSHHTCIPKFKPKKS
jgi:hypothetical protein